jgi:hypothetical protein
MTVLGKDDTNIIGGVVPRQGNETGSLPAYDINKMANGK